MPNVGAYFRGVYAAAMIAAGAGTGFAQQITGIPEVLDADTIRVEQTRVRLSGVDAPETDQLCIDGGGRKWTCGIAARNAVVSLIANRPVRCEVSGVDAYARKLAICSVGGENINRWLVREGLALAYIKYSTEFAGEEKLARDAGRGLWSGAFIAPWDWRTRTQKTAVLGHKAQGVLLSEIFAPHDLPPDPTCAIKGNVNRNGDHIFHVPGQRDYGRVRMTSTAKRWFCTEEEALAAGWRKAHR